MKFIKKKSHPKSFLKKAFLSLLAVTVVIMITLGSFLMGTYIKSANGLINKFFNDLLLQSNYSITYTNELAERLATSLSYDRDIIAFLNSDKEDSLVTIIANTAISSQTVSLTYVDGVYLYNRKCDWIFSSKDGIQSKLDDFYDDEIMSYLKSNPSPYEPLTAPIVHDVDPSDKKSFICSYVIPEYNFTGEFSGAIVVNISIDVLTNSLQGINAYNDSTKFIVTDTGGQPLSPSPFDDESDTKSLIHTLRGYAQSNSTAGNEEIKINNTRYLLTYNNNNSNGWYIFGMVPRSIIFKDIISSTIWCFAIIGLIFIFGLLFALLLAKRLNAPIEAISQMFKGEKTHEETDSMIQTEELKYMATVFNTMQNENREFMQYKRDTSFFVRQEFLDNLISGTVFYSMDKIVEQTKSLGCPYIVDKQLCMCLLKIDNYSQFLSDNNQRERWATRFAIINIASELFSEHFMCEIIQKDSDKFVVLINCLEQSSYIKFTKQLETVLREIIAQISKHLNFTLTAAYSTFFNGISHLPGMYENTNELLLLKVRYGHGKILNPHMAEDIDLNDFKVSPNDEEIFLQNVLASKTQQAQTQLDHITDTLFSYSYSEIMSYLLHLAYRIFLESKEANPSIKREISLLFKKFCSSVSECEVSGDFQEQFTAFFSGVCTLIKNLNDDPLRQNSNLAVQKVVSIIQDRYMQKDLCLSSIAEEMGLSATYIGFLFRTEKNKSVSKYILDLRMEKIAEYLRDTSWQMTKILDEVGFEPEQKNYLYTCFKKHFGVSVKQYRMDANDKDDTEEI